VREPEALHDVATHRTKRIDLLGSFHTFRDRRKTEMVSKVNDRADDQREVKCDSPR
jgi:hypothetical protein